MNRRCLTSGNSLQVRRGLARALIRFWATLYLWVSTPQYAFMLLNTSCLPTVKGLGPLLWSSYGFWRLHDEANGAGVGLEARRSGGSARRAVSASGLSAGALLLTFNMAMRTRKSTLKSASKFEILLSSSCVTNTWKTDSYVSCDARHGLVTTATGWSRPARSQPGPILEE